MTKLIKNTYSYFFEFYPTKRNRKLRKGMKEDFFFTYLLEVEDKEFPLAFKVHDYRGVMDIRSYKGCLYEKTRNPWSSDYTWTVEESLNYLSERFGYAYARSDMEEFNEKTSIIVKDNKNEILAKAMKNSRSGKYVLFEDELWEKTLEPKYEVIFPRPFGQVNKPFITIALDGNPNASFNAFQLDAAVAYAMRKHNTRINDRKNNLVTKEELLRYDKEIEVFKPAFVTDYSYRIAFQDNDKVKFALELLRKSDVKIGHITLTSTNVKKADGNCLDNDYLTSLVIQNNELTPLGEACMESQRLEMVVEDGCYIARYKVDFFD